MDKDDGSLSFLDIKPNEANKHFNGREVTQQSLINTTFWIVDYIKDVKTKYGEGRYLIKGKYELNDIESQSFKFFTNSQDIKYILDRIDELDAFPRKVSKVKRLDKAVKHQSMASWMGWLKYCNSKRLKVKLNQRLQDEIFK